MSNPIQQVATRLKALRQQRGWSLDQTAQVTGVSKAMLGQIERAESSPTIATLWKIATGFQVSFSEFIDEVTNVETQHRVVAAQSFGSVNDNILVKPLFPFDPALQCEMFVIELLPGYEHRSAPHQAGVVEHVIVVTGELEVLVHQKWQKVCPEEGLRFAADQPHGYRNVSAQKTMFHNIIHYPRS